MCRRLRRLLHRATLALSALLLAAPAVAGELPEVPGVPLQPLGAQLFEQGLGSLRGAVGTPAQIRDLVRHYENVGVDQLIFVSQAGNNKHEHICESLELFAREVMPECQERDEAHVKQKADRLAAFPRRGNFAP